jgi:hypothetical protein
MTTQPAPSNGASGGGGGGVSQGTQVAPAGIAAPATPNGAGQVAPAAPVAVQSTGGGAETTPSSAPSGSGQESRPARRSLTDDPDVREWQSAYDRQISQMQRELQAAAARAEQAQREAMELRLEGAAPEDQARFFKGELERIRTEQQRAAEIKRQEDVLTNQAFSIIRTAGIDPKDPELAPYLRGGPTPEGVAQVAMGVVRLLGKRLAEMDGEIETAKARAAQQALREAGVAHVSNEVGAAPLAEMDKKQAELAAFKKALRGKPHAYSKIQAKARELGLG